METVGFDYGQRHAVELQARGAVRDADRRGGSRTGRARLGEDHVLDIRGFGAVGETALTADRAIEMTAQGPALDLRAGPQPGVLRSMPRRWPTGGG